MCIARLLCDEVSFERFTGNVFTDSKLYKKGLMTDVELIPRTDNRRPRPLTKSEKGLVKEQQTIVSTIRSHLTPVQVMKQATMRMTRS